MLNRTTLGSTTICDSTALRAIGICAKASKDSHRLMCSFWTSLGSTVIDNAVLRASLLHAPSAKYFRNLICLVRTTLDSIVNEVTCVFYINKLKI